MNGLGNRLAFEKSPYLRQHAENPVDWYPWGGEAFEIAEREDKPVFLSIGYSACHWCHVMERECFEDEEVARLMNETFVNVKVDREERPDLDNIYMTACMMMTGRGGWPMSVIMTPDKRPFFAGTYIPKESRPGMNGMLDLVPAIGEIWKNRREEVFKAANQVTSAMGRMGSSKGETPGEDVLEKTGEQLAEVFDQANGGFGDRPKFPSPHTLLLLLRLHHRGKDPAPLSMVTATLKAMRRGGIFDHLGYGFHRYSTDEKWLLPHFEKMLYDQAMMVLACAEAYRVTGDDSLKRIAEEVHEYVASNMTDRDGAFYSAEDADSEGREGVFYLWTMDQIRQTLGDRDAQLAAAVFGLKEEGNFEDEATGERTGANVLHLVKPLSFIAQEMQTPVERLEEDLSRIRTRLLAARSRRERPLRDEKVLTDWNGLYIASLAYSARVFSRPDLSSRALRACDFILRRMRTEDGRLLHRYMEGSAGIDGFLDDYAYMLWGLVELFQATLEPRLLKEAVFLAERMIADFADEENGGFYFTAARGEELIHRYKEAMDGAMPSGNSAAAYSLARLARITGRSDFEDRALGVFKAFSGNLSKSPANYCMLLSALDFVLGPSAEVALAGDRKAAGVRNFLAALNSLYLPRTVWVPASDETVELAPFTSEMNTVDGKPAAYVCESFACRTPVTEPEEMLKLLGRTLPKQS